ncbi:hypothetical protein BGZ95_005530 [Linnemannia exigua]|uniref:Uncharacterized protein n=1 Tax=Linnemannia exigua TaxID=604196 RepID=A0AAD4H7N4_9FUNG|nr:hypothetical protein BGZ95_005530 [Linnemannia exigua]
MEGVFPVCFTTNGVYIYAVAYHFQQGVGGGNHIVLARSYSSSLNNLTWKLIGRTFKIPIFTEQWADYTYNCAWNPETSVMILTGDISDELYRPVSTGTLYRFGIEVPTMTNALQTATRHFVDIDLSGPQDDLWPSFRRNRGVLMPDISFDHSLLPSSSGNLILGKKDMPTWVFAQLSAQASHLTLAEFFDGWFPETYLTQWSLNDYGSSPQGPIKYDILAHSNDKFFVLGSVGSGGHLVGLVIPFSLSTPTPTQPDPTLRSIKVVESTLGQDCDLGHELTTSAAHGDQIFLLCYPKTQLQNVSKEIEAFQLYSFNGATFQHVCSIATAALITAANHNIAPQLTIAPDSSSKGIGAKWAYVSLDYGARSYSLDLTRNATTTATDTIHTNLGAPKPFTLDHDNEFDDWPSPSWTSTPSSLKSKDAFSAWLSYIAGILFVCILIGKLVCYRRRRERRRLAIEQAALPICPNPLHLPTHHRPRGSRVAAAASEGGVVGVTRTQYGEDASDTLPMYTLRAPPGPAADSLTSIVSEVEASNVSPPTPPLHPLLPSSPTSSPPPFHAPEPMDLPPCYASRPSSPVQSP